jgi:signal transduction histidine kinase
MAQIQALTMAIALGVVVISSVVVVTRLVGRERDRALMNTASAVVAALSDLDSPITLGPRRLAGELDQHRPAGVRIEAVDGDGAAVAAIGEGPRLHPAGDDSCLDQEGWRVCERAVGSLRVLVGRSRNEEDATERWVFLVLLALASSAVIGMAAVLNRGLARVDEALARERRFAAQASHELRTPLTVLRGELEELIARPAEGPQGARRALASAERLVQLVEALLVLGRAESRFDPGDLELLNLADLVRDEIDRCEARDGPRGLGLDLPDELLVLGNEQILGRAISNLLDNALKYATPPIEVAARTVAGSAVLTVSDHGPGISPALRERIFEPFYRDPQTRAARPGHGLGLPLARAVARAHGGDLHLHAGAGGGSVFELALPITRRGP